jgi:hypothetical protein
LDAYFDLKKQRMQDESKKERSFKPTDRGTQ